MTKQLTIKSDYQGRRGFFIMEKDSAGERVWIPSGKSKIDEEVFNKLMKTDPSFKAEVEGDDPMIMVHNPKQEAKAQKQDEKLLKQIEELQGKLKSQDSKDQEIASLKKQIAHLSKNQKAKPGPKPQGK